MAGQAGVVCLLLLAASSVAMAAAESRSSYIVHVAAEHAPRSTRPRLLARAYTSFLRDSLPAHMLRQAPRVFYAYAHAATGFAAQLTERQAVHLASQRSVLAVVPDDMMQPHTTMTPSFLGLSPSSGLLPKSNGAADVVIGVIDSGIYPMDRPSFAADASLPLPPSKFRGTCVSTPSFNGSAYCNNKLVGARFFYKGMKLRMGLAAFSEAEESLSPLDTKGHGSHTASTAAGSAGVDASFFNYGKGRAIGVAPGARIAAYKACWKHGCSDSDVLMAFDAAITDGVDVISVSLGSTKGKPKAFYRHGISVGSFSAVRSGITVSASAGNFGPGEFTVVNVAPWILTVAASTINRRFPASLVVGNGETFTGTSIYAGAPLGKAKIPLVYGEDVGSAVCEAGMLNASLVAGKIVVCDPGENGRAAKGEAVKLAGGAGAILVGDEGFGEQTLTTAHVLPVTEVKFVDGESIKKYIRMNASPVATIVFLGTVVGGTPSFPRMASFSSRGPNLLAPEILKPDVTAPGVDILAAWTGENSPSELDSDPRRVKFNIISGTSMSCPHVSGIAALLRQARPDWSPAAIKSALMTTAYNVDNAGDIIKDMSTGEASTPFVRGAGHVDPNRALNPGLVYDAGTEDYVSFLCALGYNDWQIGLLTRDFSITDCSTRSAAVGDLNYPAFSVVFGSSSGDEEVTQRRVVRNVGSNVRAMYTASITSPAGVSVTVEPPTLEFSATQRTQEYAITFTSDDGGVAEKYTFGSIVWSDGEHKVTSPIAISWPASEAAAV